MTNISNYLEEQQEAENQSIISKDMRRSQRDILLEELAHVHSYHTGYQDAILDFVKTIKEITNSAVTAVMNGNNVKVREVLDSIINETETLTNSSKQAHQELVELYHNKLAE